MFDIGKWLGKLLFTPSRYKQLRNFLLDAEAFSEYIKKITLNNYDTDGVVKLVDDPHYRKILEEYTNSELQESLAHYTRQMIVTSATYIEGIISEFFESLFLHKPKYMYEYINNESVKIGKGYIKLNEIIDAETKEDILKILSLRATKNAVNGSVEIIFKRIHNLSKQNLDKNLIERIQNIVDARNSIIHEAKEIELTHKHVEASFATAEELLKALGKICKVMKISYSDPAHLIDEREDIV